MKKKLKSFLCLLLCLSFCLSFAACKRGGEKETIGAEGEKVTYIVRILSHGDMPLANVGVYIYEDSTLQELVWYDTTNEEGTIRFEEKHSDSLVAVLAEVPTGYAVEEQYPLTGLETEIRLSAGTMSEDDEITYKPGDMMMDFTVTAADGKEYSLFGLLEGKQAVILNFYYNGCVPCKLEFPYLQEAYEEYADQIAVLAMNPIDDVDAVAQFQKEMGLSFLMAACDPKWEQIMQLTAYPTTVVVDRFGNIVLIHQGGVDSAQTFKDVFAAVTGDEYQQKIYNNITEIETTAEQGSVENPVEMGATPSFELTIEGGKEHYINFYKLNNLTLRIKDPDAYVIYNGEKYTPKNGVVSLIVTCPDVNTSVKIGFGNSSDKTKTFTVTMASQPGTLENPYSLVMGENKVKIKAGNEQGVYYIWTAKENGTLKVWCTSATAGVKYDCSLYNTANSAMRSLNAEGSVDENGQNVVSVKVNKGDKVQMIAAVLPDERWNYAAGDFTYVAEFVPGAGRDADKVEMTTYTVTVTDEAGKPMVNVNFNAVVEDKAEAFATDESGVASISLPTGSYKVTMIVPEGYTSDATEFTLTKDSPTYNIKLKIKVVVMAEYEIVVVDPENIPVENAAVILGDGFEYTKADGKVVFRLEKGRYSFRVNAPEGYVVPESNYTFAEGENTIKVTLDYAEGTAKKPINVRENPHTTLEIPAGKSLYYNLYNAGGMILTIEDADAAVTVGDRSYIADGSGKVSFIVPKTDSPATPVLLQVINSGTETETYTWNLAFPAGHRENPVPLEELGQLQTQLENGNDELDYYYYTWTAPEEGIVTFYVSEATEGVVYDISLTNNTNSAKRTLSVDGNEGQVKLNVAAGDDVSIQVTVTDFGTVEQEANVTAVGSFTAQENTEDTKLTYSVTVLDDADNAMPGVKVIIGHTELTTDENGYAATELVEGEYTVQITVPEGYKTANAQLTLTKDAPAATVVLEPVRMVNYTVNLTHGNIVYTGSVKVQILKDGSAVVYEEITTTGAVTANLPEGEYTVKLVIEDTTFTYDALMTVLSPESPNLTIALGKVVKNLQYSITVINAAQEPQTGVLVELFKDGAIVNGASAPTNTNGVATITQLAGNYEVRLRFSNGKDCYYAKSTSNVTANKTSITIMLAAEPDSGNMERLEYINKQKLYVLSEGYTHIQVGADKKYYANKDGVKACLFKFEPQAIGEYQIYLDNANVELYHYGAIEHYIKPLDKASNYDTNALYVTLYEANQVGNVMVYLGVEVVEGITDLGIRITRVGDPAERPEHKPYSEEWMVGAVIPTKKYQLTLSGNQTLKFVDVHAQDASPYTLVYSTEDGYYHIGSATGPVLYFKPTQGVGENSASIADKIETTGMKKFFYDATGAFVKKEDYTPLMTEYVKYVDATYGVYPVTKHLAYMIQNGMEEWWTVDGGLLTGETVNKDIAWMFCCCYIG